MSHSEILKRNFPDIIHSTVNMCPENYDIIRFDKFLEKTFPNLNAFISSEIIGEIRKTLKQKYGNDSNCVKEHGVLKTVDLSTLKYYQQDVGINGPRHSTIDEPVFVINTGSESILLNGYHRVLFCIIDDKLEINSYTLTVNINETAS